MEAHRNEINSRILQQQINVTFNARTTQLYEYTCTMHVHVASLATPLNMLIFAVVIKYEPTQALKRIHTEQRSSDFQVRAHTSRER